MRSPTVLATAAAAVALLLSASPAVAQAPPNSTPTPTALFDVTFGHAGHVNNLFPELNHGTTITEQPDGKLLFAGTKVGPSTDFAVGRLNVDGSVDQTFGTAGIAVLDGGSKALNSGRSHAAVQPDGKIVVAHTTSTAGSQREQWVVGRMLPSGEPDTTFSGDGRVTLSLPGQSFYLPIAGLMVGTDGTVLVAGSHHDGLVAARLQPDGSLDRTYGAEGRLLFPLPGTDGQVQDVLLDDAGNLVASGTTSGSGTDSTGDMLVVRLLPSGAGDPGFGFQGTAIIDSGVGEDRGETLTIDDAGRILVAATFGRNGNGIWPIGVVRLMPNGSLDPSFGVGGRLPLDTGRTSDHQFPNAIATMADGRVVVAGEYMPSYGSPEDDVISKFVAVLADNGTRDPAFDGEDGVVFVPQGYQVGGTALVTQDGKVVLHSTFERDPAAHVSRRRFGVARAGPQPVAGRPRHPHHHRHHPQRRPAARGRGRLRAIDQGVRVRRQGDPAVVHDLRRCHRRRLLVGHPAGRRVGDVAPPDRGDRRRGHHRHRGPGQLQHRRPQHG